MNDLAVSNDDKFPSPAQRRLRGFAIHLAVYFVVMIGSVAATFVLAPGNMWFAFPMVAWGAPLALHAAFAMGLFGGNK